jgi:hypothetical protein
MSAKINRMSYILKKIVTRGYLINYLINRIVRLNPYVVNDKLAIKSAYYFAFGRELDLKNPQTYNEKLQWMKLYYRRPIMTKMVDKYHAKEYVAEIIGDEYIIPTLGAWEHFDDIDFDTLPSQFVLKTTHDSGNVIVVRDKNLFDKTKARKILEDSLKTDFYIKTREWPYKNVKRLILAEKYMEDETGELRDFKFFCFDGKVRYLFVATERQKPGVDVKFDFFDGEFNHLQLVNGHQNSEHNIPKPQGFILMKNLAEKLSAGFPHVRVDLYSINGKIYFGELTFFHFSGLVPFNPEKWDSKFGQWLHLPKAKVL